VILKRLFSLRYNRLNFSLFKEICRPSATAPITVTLFILIITSSSRPEVLRRQFVQQLLQRRVTSVAFQQQHVSFRRAVFLEATQSFGAMPAFDDDASQQFGHLPITQDLRQ